MVKKISIPVIFILGFTLYLIFSYNSLKGRSYLYEPFYISLTADMPAYSSLKLTYQTFNDPTIVHSAELSAGDLSAADTHTFRIDTSYRLTNFSIYFQNLREGDDVTISQLKASNEEGREFYFSLENDDLVATEILHLEQLNDSTIHLIKKVREKPIGAALYFNVRGSINGVFVRTDHRVLEIPSFPAFLAILILAIGLACFLYPVLTRLEWKGIAPGAILLALAILIMPTGEKICNLVLILAVAAGMADMIRKGRLHEWIKVNRKLLLIIMTLAVIYSIALLVDVKDPSNMKLLKIKLGLPLTLMAIALNTNTNREIQIQYAALLTGVLISVVMHFGWIIMLVDSVELKSRLFSRPQYYLESAVFSRVHHSYLSILYLASLTTLFLKSDILSLRRKDLIIFKVLITIGLVFAFSRAAIFSLFLLILFGILHMIVRSMKVEFTRYLKFIAGAVFSITFLTVVFVHLDIESMAEKVPVRGFTTRFEIWENSANLIKQKPLFGWGPGKYKDALKASNGSNSFNSNTWRMLNTHNQFLETSGMFGLLAGIGLAWFLLFPTGFSRQHPTYSEFIIAAAIIFITAFFFESYLNRNLGILVFGLSYGLIIKMKTIYGS